jgi:pseudomonalisin
MQSGSWAKQSVSKWCMGAALALPLVAAVLPVHAAGTGTKWVDTATKAFLTPNQVRTFAAAPQMEAVSGESIRIVVSMKAHDFGKLRDLANAVTRRGNPDYHNFLTPADFLDRFAPTPRQIERVVAYLLENGFVNINISENRLFITADGTVGAVKRAFNTPILHFTKNGRLMHANAATAQVPDELGDAVLAILGLQNVTRAHTMAVKGPLTQAKTLAGGVARGHYPTEFSTIYQADSLPTASNTAVGIITLGGADQATLDLAHFTNVNTLPGVSVSTVKTGDPNGNYDDDPEGQIEWDLDSQNIVGAAGGAVKQLIFYASDMAAPGNTGLTRAYNKAVTDNVAKVINVSLGWCEADAFADGSMAAEDQIFTIAVAQGQTFSVSSGDEGVYECNNRGMPKGNIYSLSWPATSPNVIAVGGTTLYTRPADGTFANETVWNEGLDDNGKLWASTGGFSAFEPLPGWQHALPGRPRWGGRAVPDVSFDAAQSTGSLIYASGNIYQVGGTSLSSPLFVGFWARIQSAHANSLGFPAPSIYSAVAATPLLAFDVTSGNNGYGGFGYKAGPGWDAATGWGSFRMANFASYVSRYPFAR